MARIIANEYQKKLFDSLQVFWRANLRPRVAPSGVGRSTFILESAMRFVRIAAVFFLVLCFIDAVQDCTLVSGSLNLPDDDDYHQLAALFAAPILLAYSSTSICSLKGHISHHFSVSSIYHPIRR